MAIKKGIALTILIIVLFALMTSTALAMPDPLRGIWVATDIDGSSMRLTISGSGSPYRLNLYDDGATVCGLDPNGVPLYAARATGTGTLSGNTLSGTWRIICMQNPPVEVDFSPADFSFEYDPGTNTIIDFTGVVWTRR